MLSDAVFVDLSLSSKYFSMDEAATGLPSLFGWLVDICSYETIVPKLYEFFHDGGQAVLDRHPDQAGVVEFRRKAACLLSKISRDLGSPNYGTPHLQGSTLVFPEAVPPTQKKPRTRSHTVPRKRNHSNTPTTGAVLQPSQRSCGAPRSATPITLTRDKDGFLIPPLPLHSNTGTNKRVGEEDLSKLVAEQAAPAGPSPKVKKLNIEE
ncbi:hypothetical protein Pelo_5091 [Pelomyxa schiedti]|nr:hypothetical protein Pelo_5091 [Pelomyxa schiedti]